MISRAHCACPYCGVEIELLDMKDFESFSQIELTDHIETEHPDTPDPDRFGMPYVRVRFDDA